MPPLLPPLWAEGGWGESSSNRGASRAHEHPGLPAAHARRDGQAVQDTASASVHPSFAPHLQAVDDGPVVPEQVQDLRAHDVDIRVLDLRSAGRGGWSGDCLQADGSARVPARQLTPRRLRRPTTPAAARLPRRRPPPKSWAWGKTGARRVGSETAWHGPAAFQTHLSIDVWRVVFEKHHHGLVLEQHRLLDLCGQAMKVVVVGTITFHPNARTHTAAAAAAAAYSHCVQHRRPQGMASHHASRASTHPPGCLCAAFESPRTCQTRSRGTW